MLSTLFTLGIYVTGLFSADIREFGDLTHSPFLKAATRAIYYLLPNFHNFNAIGVASHGEAVPFSLVAQNTVYTFCYVSIVLLGASAIFSRRNLK